VAVVTVVLSAVLAVLVVVEHVKQMRVVQELLAKVMLVVHTQVVVAVAVLVVAELEQRVQAEETLEALAVMVSTGNPSALFTLVAVAVLKAVILLAELEQVVQVAVALVRLTLQTV
jgi:hypothetical protein